MIASTQTSALKMTQGDLRYLLVDLQIERFETDQSHITTKGGVLRRAPGRGNAMTLRPKI